MRRKHTHDELRLHLAFRHGADYCPGMDVTLRFDCALLKYPNTHFIQARCSAFGQSDFLGESNEIESYIACRHSGVNYGFYCGRMEEKTTAPKVMQLRDWEELFGHKPMEEETNMPMPEPASGASKQETMKSMQKHDMR